MALSGKGTEFRRWNGTGEWEEIGEITNISGPGMSRETIDTTALDTIGGYRTFITGFRTPGTLSLSINFTRDTYDTMKADFESDAAVDYEIVLPDADQTTIEFQGFVTELPLTIPADEKIAMEVTIQITGQVTVNSGSGPSAGV